MITKIDLENISKYFKNIPKKEGKLRLTTNSIDILNFLILKGEA